MEYKVKQFELHNPLFMGMNIGLKVATKDKSGMKASFNVPMNVLIVEYNGAMAILPASNVASMQPDNQSEVNALRKLPSTPPVPPDDQIVFLPMESDKPEPVTLTGKKKVISHT